MNIAQVFEQELGQENDLDKNDWYFLHYQYQVLYQILAHKNITREGICDLNQVKPQNI